MVLGIGPLWLSGSLIQLPVVAVVVVGGWWQRHPTTGQCVQSLVATIPPLSAGRLPDFSLHAIVLGWHSPSYFWWSALHSHVLPTHTHTFPAVLILVVAVCVWQHNVGVLEQLQVDGGGSWLQSWSDYVARCGISSWFHS